MRKAYNIVPMIALLMAGTWHTASAQTTQVDEALVLHFDLRAVAQGAVTTTAAGTDVGVVVSRITSKDIIQALGVSLGDTFSDKARLVLLTPTNNLENWTVQVREGTNGTDVTSFFVHQPGSPSVGSATVRRNGAVVTTQYSVDGFSLRDSGFEALSVHFDVSGFTALTEEGVVNRHGQVVGQMDSFNADVSGTGDSNGQTLIINGSVSAESIGTVTVVTQVAGPS